MMYSGISETGDFLNRNKRRKEHFMSFTTSKSLLIRIHNGNEIAWSEFYSTYRPLIFLCGKDYHLSNTEIDDLLSRTMVKFFNAQKQFTYKPELGRFRNYFRNLIRNCMISGMTNGAPISAGRLWTMSAAVSPPEPSRHLKHAASMGKNRLLSQNS